MTSVVSPHPTLVAFLASIFGILTTATLILGVLRVTQPKKNFRELGARTRSWWVMMTAFSVAIVLGKLAVVAFFALVSVLALREYFGLVPFRSTDRRVFIWAYLSIPLQYYWIATGWYGMFAIFVPVYLFLLLPARMLLNQETRGFLHAAGTLHWGLMICVFCIGHVAYLAVLPENKGQPVNGVLIILYLVFLTEFNDVLQFVWGKIFGSHRVIPKVSPGKTWEGLIGGIVCTTLIATTIGPIVTPMNTLHSFCAGLIISLSGFIGDINISALKRDLGVKDSGDLIPGHGGILDRVDSISFSAPLFFHFIRYFYF